ncbi:cutinase family protein [Mycolicibacterium vaccae]|uniref:cutinase family protein n=1 Tax=Mycolicibacterium vaccae TaxID=1810 RepID=UPI003CEB3785
MSAVLFGLAVVQAPVVSASSCPDVEVVFARGTSSRPGIGSVGKAFVSSLKWKLLGKKVSTYAVNYPASWNFPKSTSQGAVDANRRVQYVARVCPDTKIVLGGMSQGAGVIDLILIGNRPIWFFKTAPLPDAMTKHVAAVAVFGNPARDIFGAPLSQLSPLYGHKTIDMCANGDPYCSNGRNLFAHFAYPINGMTNTAATFVAQRVLSRQS